MSSYAPVTTNPYDRLGSVPTFDLTSPDISNGVEVPTPQRSGIFGGGGADRSPALQWSSFPPEARSFVVTMFDPSAPTPSGFWHWVLADLPASVTALVSGAGDQDDDPAVGGVAVRNDAGRRRYIGAAPPEGIHTYYVAVHALDVDRLVDDRSISPVLLHVLMRAHVVARALIAPVARATPE